MIYRKLGASGLDVSVICLGTMMFGGRTDEAAATEIVANARDNGINFIDTADAYGEGASEEISGRAIAAARDYWVLATKVGNQIGEGRTRFLAFAGIFVSLLFAIVIFCDTAGVLLVSACGK